MNLKTPVDTANFFVAGINHKKADAQLRGVFSVSSDQYEAALLTAKKTGLESMFILSTCNRTEIYGFADNADQLISLICSANSGTEETFKKLAYVKNGVDAINHFFKVGAGLDSQILGDYEIIGQLKKAVGFAKDRGFINCFIERLFNSVLQASKCIKSDTALSNGTVSVSFAAIQYIRKNITITPETNILVIGTGKIGRNSAKNIVDYLQTNNVTLFNRSEEKAIQLASELNLKYAPYDVLNQCIECADVIITATASNQPVVLKNHLENTSKKLVIDLSIPGGVEPEAAFLDNVTLVSLDELSALNDDTLQKRLAEMPKAQSIVQDHLKSFTDWYVARKNAALISALKSQLLKMNAVSIPIYYRKNRDHKIADVLKITANKMRKHYTPGCHYLEGLNEYMA